MKLTIVTIFCKFRNSECALRNVVVAGITQLGQAPCRASPLVLVTRIMELTNLTQLTDLLSSIEYPVSMYYCPALTEVSKCVYLHYERIRNAV